MKKLFRVKILVATSLILIVAILSFDYYENNYKASFTRPISEYFKMIEDQEKVLANEELTPEQDVDLENCYKQDNFRCFLEYFESYAYANTLEKTFSHLSFLMKERPEYKIYCHQMAHGIGHGEIRKQRKGEDKLGEILRDFSMNQYFKNIRSCGSGFFHGLIEELVKDLSDKDELTNYFNNVCNDEDYKNVLKGDCIHGLGHASYLQTEYNLEDSLYICDKVSKDNTYNKFNCYTGVFMEANLDLAQSDVILKQDKYFTFPMCDKLTNELQRRACFFESVLQFKSFTGVSPQDASYADMIPLCKNFNNDLYRLICIRNISIRSISESPENDLQKMCIDNVGSRAERIMCVTGFAHKLVMSITNEERNELYFQYTKEICNYLDRKESLACQDIIKNNVSKVYIVDEKDLLLNK